MKITLKGLLRYLPLLLGLAILAIAIPLVPWAKVGPYLQRLSPLSLGLLFVASLVYYFGRSLRYWVMLRMLGHPLSFDKVALACLVAQPVSVLPAGELYRSTMLRRYGNISLKHGAPTVSAQAIAESIGLIGVALIGAIVLQRYVRVLLVMAVLFAGLWFYIRWNNSRTSHRVINKLPWVNISHAKLRSYLDKNRFLLSGRNFLALLGISLISTGAGIAMVLIASRALGAGLDPVEAVVVYTVPTALEALSFLPGGLGVNEQGSVGLMTLLGVNLPLAVAITLIVRLATLGMGFVYGFIAMGVARFGRYERFD